MERPAPTPEEKFFVTGGTLSLNASSYIVRKADNDLFNALRDGRVCYVLTSRQMGKSSICVRTMARLQQENIRTAFIDLTRIGGGNVTPEQWYAGLLGEVGRGLGIRNELFAFWKEREALGPMQRFFEALIQVALKKIEQPIVLFIDEVDSSKSVPFSTDEFFAGIRECFNRRVHEEDLKRLTFCLLGVAVPSDLISDASTTPFNIGERIQLCDFTAEEARSLAPGLGPDGVAIVDRIVYWTGGHPFLTQSLCAAAAESGIKKASEVDELVSRAFFGATSRETNINLADVGNRVLNSAGGGESVEQYRADILSLYEAILVANVNVADDESNRLISTLKLAGLIKPDGKNLTLRNRIYQKVFGPEWIAENMPQQEVKRQRAAFLMGIIRAGAVGLGLGMIIAALALKAYQSAQDAHVAQLEAERQKNLAIEARKEATINAADADAQRALAERRAAQVVHSLAMEKAASEQAKRDREKAIMAEHRAEMEAARAKVAEREATVAAAKEREAKLAATIAAQREAAARHDAEDLLYASSVRLAGENMRLGTGRAAYSILANQLESDKEGKRRGWEWDYLWGQLQGGKRFDTGTSALSMQVTPKNEIAILDGDLVLRKYKPEMAGLIGTINLNQDGQGLYGAISNDGKMVARTTSKGEVEVYDVDTMKPLKKLQVSTDPVDFVRFQPVQHLLYASSGQETRLYDTSSWSYLGSSSVTNAAKLSLAEAGAILADGRAVLPNFDTGASFLILPGLLRADPFKQAGSYRHLITISAIQSAHSGDTFASGDLYGTILVMDASKAAPKISPLNQGSRVLSLAFSHKDDLIASGGIDGSVTVWNALNGKRVAAYRGRQSVVAITFSADDRKVYFGTTDGKSSFFDVQNSQSHWETDALAANFNSLAVTPDSSTIVIAQAQPSFCLRYVDSRSRQLKGLTFLPAAPTAITIAPKTGRVYVGYAGAGFIDIVNKDRKLAGRILLPDHRFRFPITISPDERYLVVSDGTSGLSQGIFNGKPLIIDLRTQGVARQLSGWHSTVIAASFSADGRELFVGGDDGVVRAYETGSWTLDNTVPKLETSGANQVLSLATSKDGNWLATSNQVGAIRLYNLKTKASLTLQGHSGEVDAVKFMPDSKTVVAGGVDGTVRFWNLPTGREVLVFDVEHKIYSLAVSPSGENVLALTDDGRLSTWNAPRPVVAATRANDGDTSSFEGQLGGKQLSAIDLVAKAKERAIKSGKRLLISFVSPDDRYSRRFIALMKSPEFGARIARNYEVVLINDELSLTRPGVPGSYALLGAYGGNSFPFWVIVDKWGNRLVDSYADLASGHLGQNIGVPVADWERDYFMRVIAKYASFSKEDLNAMSRYLSDQNMDYDAVARSEASYQGFGNRVDKLVSEGRLADALKIIDAGVKLGVRQYGLRNLRAQYRALLGDYAGALEDLDYMSSSVGQRDTNTLSNLLVMQIAVGENAKAVDTGVRISRSIEQPNLRNYLIGNTFRRIAWATKPTDQANLGQYLLQANHQADPSSLRTKEAYAFYEFRLGAKELAWQLVSQVLASPGLGYDRFLSTHTHYLAALIAYTLHRPEAPQLFGEAEHLFDLQNSQFIRGTVAAWPYADQIEIELFRQEARRTLNVSK
ncbi:MAG: AAA-like domain-containing protein [Armatimonadetes bacterium]|nr:AAA-like domain-containing protein [Armatimonadota bacterium]